MNSQIQEFDLEKIYVASKPQFHICETGLKTVPTIDYCKSTIKYYVQSTVLGTISGSQSVLLSSGCWHARIVKAKG